jgi:hypothetical protein
MTGLRSSLVARRWRFSLLAALLLIAQLLLVAHGPHDALADDERSACVVCVLGHDLGSAVFASPPVLPMPVSGLPAVAIAESEPFAVLAAAYLARGPPSRG